MPPNFQKFNAHNNSFYRSGNFWAKIFLLECRSNNHLSRYQLLVGLLFAMMEAPHAWCMLMHKFVAVPIDHWFVCHLMIMLLPNFFPIGH